MDSQGITAWILQNIAPILLVGLGLLIVFSARKGRWSEAFSTIGIAALGLALAAGATSFIAFGDDLAAVMFNG